MSRGDGVARVALSRRARPFGRRAVAQEEPHEAPRGGFGFEAIGGVRQFRGASGAIGGGGGGFRAKLAGACPARLLERRGRLAGAYLAAFHAGYHVREGKLFAARVGGVVRLQIRGDGDGDGDGARGGGDGVRGDARGGGGERGAAGAGLRRGETPAEVGGVPAGGKGVRGAGEGCDRGTG